MLEELTKIFRQGSNNLSRWPDCADTMIADINALTPELVLDLGCGANLYKAHIPNLIGLEAVTKEADVTGLIEDLPFDNNSTDVCICMGSVNFGSHELINAQLDEIQRVTRPGGRAYFRVMCDHNHPLYYPWNKKTAYTIAQERNWKFRDGPRVIYKNTTEERLDTVGNRGKSRLYWVWKI
jgi:SAM-dependent methyltransferase